MELWQKNKKFMAESSCNFSDFTGIYDYLKIRGGVGNFNIGVKKMRRLAEDNLGAFAVYSGNRYLIIRTKFEEFLQNNPMI